MEDEYEDSGKTVEELAREAMKAIKNSQKQKEREEEEDAKIKEHNARQEIENKIKKKMKKVEREMEELEKKREPDIDTSFMVHWSNADKKGLKFEGNYNDKYTFRINRGIMLFHLYVEDKELISESWHHNSHTSVNLVVLKEKADKILNKFIKKSEELKKVEESRDGQST